MAKNNNNAGFHFVHYHHRDPSIADAEEYLYKQEIKKKQSEHLKYYNELNERDKPLSLHHKDSSLLEHINYYNKEKFFEMIGYPVRNRKKRKDRMLYIWVDYDIGGENTWTGTQEKRGYYLYFTHRFEKHWIGRKLLLFEVNRQSKSSLNKAINMSKLYAKKIIENYYSFLEIDWQHPSQDKNNFTFFIIISQTQENFGLLKTVQFMKSKKSRRNLSSLVFF